MFKKILTSTFYDKWFVLALIALVGIGAHLYISHKEKRELHESVIHCHEEAMNRFQEAGKEYREEMAAHRAVYNPEMSSCSAWQAAQVRFHSCMLLEGIYKPEEMPNFEWYIPQTRFCKSATGQDIYTKETVPLQSGNEESEEFPIDTGLN
jgi:hypothetical protein